VQALAPALNAKVELFSVVNTVPFTTGIGPEGTFAPEVYEQLVEAETESAERHLAVVAKDLQIAGCEVTRTISMGQPAEAIIDAVGNAPDSTLIAMATHGRTGLARFTFGSVSGQVMRASDAPVFLVRSLREQPRSLDSILVPLDGSTGAEAVLPAVDAIAPALTAQVCLLMVDDGHPEATTYLDQIAKRLTNAGVKQVLHRIVAGDPAPAILDMAERTHSSLIAMATHCRSGVQHWVFGSVAEHVLHEATIPTLMVRISEKSRKSGNDPGKLLAVR
jgi:nucleotide-binding universal stress UspA family protein